MKRKCFTLIELLVVIAIIAIEKRRKIHIFHSYCV
ncbi:MAG: prepilin-type N-terminal cleavage/methylation domain-containing protein [Lentisphaeria bacterium]|nr:prepilin-type N-terminal cleavage/methylation domain-containing protein [Lentisphaeria bacterium]